MQAGTKRNIAVAGALVLFMVFLLIPRIPKAKADSVASQVTEVDDEVQEAVDMVNGEQPMQGILKLRDILEKDPKNIDAAWHLGQFSITTGQYEKAAERFEQVVDIDQGERYPEALVFLGKTHATLGNTDKAKASFEQYIEIEQDQELVDRVKELIQQLEVESTQK
jgi:lipopolysaccharide biosynthesis regulator YciM